MKRLLFLLLLLGCSEETGDVQVYFCPENCQELFESMKDDYCAVYDYKDIKFSNLVTEDGRRGLMHNKFCVNSTHVLTGSYNPTKSGHDDSIILVKSKTLVKNYQSAYASFHGKTPKTTHKFTFNNRLWENYFCPRDNCQEQVLRTLDKAEKSIRFMTFSFTDKEIAKLLERKSKSIDVKGLMEAQRITMEYNQYRTFTFQVYLDTNPKLLHHKVFIIDEKIVILGSYNPTKAANTINDENILIIHDPKIAKLYLNEFSSLIESN